MTMIVPIMPAIHVGKLFPGFKRLLTMRLGAVVGDCLKLAGVTVGELSKSGVGFGLFLPTDKPTVAISSVGCFSPVNARAKAVAKAEQVG